MAKLLGILVIVGVLGGFNAYAGNGEDPGPALNADGGPIKGTIGQICVDENGDPVLSKEGEELDSNALECVVPSEEDSE